MNILCLCKKCFIKDNNKNISIDNYINKHEIKIINQIHNNECFFCLESLNNGNKCIFVSCCNTTTHVNCFKKWCERNNTTLCPLCIRDL